MNKINTFIFILLIATLIYGCAEKQSNYKDGLIDYGVAMDQFDQIDKITINPKKKRNSILVYDSLFADYSCISLITPTNKDIIGDIDQIKFYEDKIYVADYSQSKGIYIFDKTGSHINTIKQLGQGPEEYVDIRFVNFNTALHRIELYDSRKGKIMFYDLSGNYLFSKDIPFTFDSFTFLNGAYYFYCKFFPSEQGNYRIVVTDSLFNFKNGLLPYEDEMKLTMALKMDDNFYNNKDHVYFYESYNNIIYELSGNDILPHKMVRFSDKGLPNDYINRVGKSLFSEISKTDYSYLLNRAIVDPPFYFFTYNYDDVLQYYLEFEKGSGEIKQHSYAQIFHPNDKFHVSQLIYADSNHFYFLIDPQLLSENQINQMRDGSLLKKEVEKARLKTTGAVVNYIILKCRVKSNVTN